MATRSSSEPIPAAALTGSPPGRGDPSKGFRQDGFAVPERVSAGAGIKEHVIARVLRGGYQCGREAVRAGDVSLMQAARSSVSEVWASVLSTGTSFTCVVAWFTSSDTAQDVAPALAAGEWCYQERLVSG
jgi:hypothetical protein